MTNWRKELEKTLRDLMPYAFFVNDKRTPMLEEEFRECLGYLQEQVDIQLKIAFKAGARAGHSLRVLSEGTPVEEVLDFLSDRDFENWQKSNE